MTFGETLGAILDSANIKQTQLAAHLGYDVSYISRWLNGTKLPSVKNNSPIFNQIADCVVKCLSPEESIAVCQSIGYSGDTSPEKLRELVIDALRESYTLNAGKLSQKRSSLPQFEYNSRISWVTVSRTEVNAAMGKLLSAETWQPGCETVKVLSMSGCDDFAYSECKKFWAPIVAQMAPSSKIHIDMVAPFWQHEHWLGVARDTLIFLFGIDNRIEVDFYLRSPEFPSNYSLWVMNNIVCVEGDYNRFLKKYKTMFTQDKYLVSEFYGAGMEELRTKSKVIGKSTFDELYRSKFFQSFMLDGSLATLQNVMPVLFMSPELEQSLYSRYSCSDTLSEMSDFFKKTNVSWSAIIYRSSIINFFFDGKASLNGRIVTLTKQERCLLLQTLLDKMDGERGNLIILDDANPVFNREDLDCALFISDRSMFALSPNSSEESHVIITANDSTVIRCFHELINSIYGLSDSFTIRNGAAVDFIRQGFKLIQDN